MTAYGSSMMGYGEWVDHDASSSNRGACADMPLRNLAHSAPPS